MTKKQLFQIEKFSKPYYRKTGRYHGWDHILRVRKHALNLAKDYEKVDTRLLEAACYLHDLGRSRKTLKDSDHVKISMSLSKNFLKEIGLKEDETKTVCNAIFCHDIANIKFAEAIEAKILFDADKLEIASVNGFIRTCCWLVEERRMKPYEAIKFLWNNIKTAWHNDYVQTKKARAILKREISMIEGIVSFFNKWEQASNK